MQRLPHTPDYATYVQILTWFFDSPLTLCPLSVHRTVLAGKELGKGVGQWGLSTVAGAIKRVDVTIVAECMPISLSLFRSLVQSFPDSSLDVSVAVDGRSSRRAYTWYHIPPLKHLVPQSYRDGEAMRSSCSSVFGLEQAESTRSIMRP